MCARIAAHSLSVNQIQLRLKLEREADYSLTLDLPVPILDVQVFVKLLHLELSARPPVAPVERIRLELKPVEPRVTQHGLFLPASPEPEKLEITLARIRNLVGSANLGTPELIDTHRPDSFLCKVGTLACQRASAGLVHDSKQGAHQKLVLRRFRPLHHAQVWRAADGQPVRISSSKAQGRVIAYAGPWHTSGNWWTPEAWDREEWDVETAASLLRIHHDRRRSEWFVEGSYD